MAERIQKLLAQAGLGSRREIESWIEQGRVVVNGRVARLGDQAEASDQIVVSGRPVELSAPTHRVIVYHKPEGEVCTRADPEGRESVFDHLPRLLQGRWVSIGRLDLNTSGLLLFTTDGDLAHRLMHPSHEVEREYAVRVLGEVSPEILQRLLQGVELDDGMARFDSLREAGGSGANHWYHVTLKEGRNREVRRLWESQGVRVSRLIRVRFGPIELGRDLGTGRWRELEPHQMRQIYETAGLKWQRPAPGVARRRPSRPPRGRRPGSGRS